MKLDQADALIVKEDVRRVLRGVDNQYDSSDFVQDWCVAELRVEKIGSKRRACLPVYAFSGVIAVVFLYSLFVFTRPELSESPLLSETPVSVEGIETTNPDNYWITPTDELLKLDTLSYQNKFITFATYDPITMEMR